jgi:hypothetical protein
MFPIPEKPTTDFLDLMLLPMVFAFFAVFMYAGSALRKKKTGSAGRWGWTFWIPIVIGIYIGLQRVVAINDPFYKTAVNSGRVTVTHYLTLVVPFIVLGVIKLWGFLSKREKGF